MLTAGIADTKLRGLMIQDLGFQDRSSNRAITGAIHLVDVESFNLTNVHCRGISNNSNNTTDLAYAEVRIFNNPGVQNAQRMFRDPITLGTSLVSAGTLSSPSRNTAVAQAVSFIFNAPNTEIIAPKGFIVEAIQ